MKCKVNRTEFLARLKLGQKISGGIREDEAKLCYLEIKEGRLEINTLRHGAQWYTGLLDLIGVSEEGRHAVPVDDIVKVVERLETEELILKSMASKFRIQGGKRYGTVPSLDSEFPISSIGDNVVDGYEGPNEFATIIRGLCTIGVSGVSTIWGAVRLGDDGRAGATDTGNLIWTPLPLLNGTGREILIPIQSFVPVANMIGNIKVRVSDSFVEFTSDRGVYKARLLAKDPPPYQSLINQRTAFETAKFPLQQLIVELDAFSKVVSSSAIIVVKDRELTVKTPPGSLVEFSTTSEFDGDLKCRFLVNPNNILPVAKLLGESCEVFKGTTSHLTLKSEETIAIVSCLDGSLKFA